MTAMVCPHLSTRDIFKMSLLNTTIELLQKRPVKLDLKQISRDLHISYGWLCMFHQGKIENPGIKHIQMLHDYLVEKHKDQPKLPM